MKKLAIIISWILVILWMTFLFTMSSKVREESNNISTGVTKKTVQIIKQVYPNVEINMKRSNYIVRKNAHFFGYLILGMLSSLVLRLSGVKDLKLFVFSLLFCILYAISDEVHQYFVPGRSAEVRDVLIDSLGSSIGIIFNFIITVIYRKNFKTRRKNY